MLKARDPEATEVYCHLSPESPFFRDPERRAVILGALKKQGIGRLILPDLPHADSLVIPGYGAGETGLPELVTGSPARKALEGCRAEYCLILQDWWYPGMNLAELTRNRRGEDFICASVLIEEGQPDLPGGSFPAFSPEGRLLFAGDTRLPVRAVYAGAFCCSPRTLRQFWAQCTARGRLTLQDCKLTPPWRGQPGDGQMGFYAPPGLRAAQSWLSSELRPALFLDRDGVINLDTHYPHKPAELILLAGIVPVIKAARSAGYRIMVLTNQSGVARGYFTEKDVRRFHDAIETQLAQHKTHVDGFWVCPFHTQGTVFPYARASADRKPLPGMAIKAMQRFPTKLRGSLMVGDRQSDRLLLPGLETILLAGKHSGPIGSEGIVKDHQDLVRYFSERIRTG